MICRRAWGALLGLLFVVSTGCRPGDRVLLDDSTNPDVALGLSRVSALDHDGAIEAFERALVANPGSVRAHYELGLLYERQKREFVTAIYHYNRVLKYKQNGWPADNARLLIDGCRQELIKAEALAPVALAMQQELEKLRTENQALRDQLAAAAARPANLASATGATPAAPPPSRITSGRDNGSPASMRLMTEGSLTPAGAGPSSTARTQPTGLRRTHRVQAGETLASIGRSYRVSLPAMLAANPSIKPRYLAVGTVVNIPAP